MAISTDDVALFYFLDNTFDGAIIFNEIGDQAAFQSSITMVELHDIKRVLNATIGAGLIFGFTDERFLESYSSGAATMGLFALVQQTQMQIFIRQGLMIPPAPLRG